MISMTKSIGIWRSWALVAGMMIGSGIFTLPALLAPYGSYSFIGWGVTGFGALCLALSYSYLSSRKPGLGGPYFYVFEAFGVIPAAIVCWGYWISLVSSIAAISLSFAGYSQRFLPVLNDYPIFYRHQCTGCSRSQRGSTFYHHRKNHSVSISGLYRHHVWRSNAHSSHKP